MLIGYRQVSICFGFFSFLVTVLLILSAMSLSAQTIEIKLVDGRNGHPMVGASSYVNVWVGALPDAGLTPIGATEGTVWEVPV